MSETPQVKRFLTATVTDERGRDVPVVRELQSLPSPVAVWRKRVALPKHVRVSVMTAWGFIGYASAAWCFITVSITTVLLSFSSGIDVVAETREFRVMALFWLSAPAMFLLGIQASWAWSGRQKAARLMAARGMCPSCTATLLGAREHDDVCVGCGTCQASWRLGTPEKCPSCRYDLTGAVGVQDFITCPECAARWPAPSERRKRHEALVEHGSLTDDAGEDVANLSNRKSKRQARDLRSKDERERAGLLSWCLLLGGLLGIWLLPGLAIYAIITVAERFTSEPTAQVLGMLVVWSFIGALLPRWIRVIERVRIQSCRRLSICPACDADMCGVPAGGDGLTACPACRARWKLPVRPTAVAT